MTIAVCSIAICTTRSTHSICTTHSFFISSLTLHIPTTLDFLKHTSSPQPPFISSQPLHLSLCFFLSQTHKRRRGGGGERPLGRMRTVPSLLMVLEMRSGMEMRRFDPIPLSFRNPAMAYRSLYSARHTSSSNSTPPQPCSVSDATSSCIISSVTTSPTLKSRVSGLSMSICTSVISCAYPSLCDVCPCVTCVCHACHHACSQSLSLDPTH